MSDFDGNDEFAPRRRRQGGRKGGTGFGGKKKKKADDGELTLSSTQYRKRDPHAPKKPPTRPAKDYVLWLMGRREYSRLELEQRLKLKGYPETDIAPALDWLQEHNFQSDERFAASLVRQQSNRLGNRRLAQTLKQKGVSAEIAVEVIATTDDEDGRADSAISKYARLDLSDFEVRQKAREKAFRFLTSRGFSFDVAKRAWKRMLDGQPDDDVDFE